MQRELAKDLFKKFESVDKFGFDRLVKHIYNLYRIYDFFYDPNEMDILTSRALWRAREDARLYLVNIAERFNLHFANADAYDSIWYEFQDLACKRMKGEQ